MKYKFLKLGIAGKSVAGRSIHTLKIGEASDPILYCAAMHGSERVTATVLLKFIEELCEAVASGGKIADVDARRALYGRSVVFVPLCNPDGCEIALKGAAGAGEGAGRVYKLCGGEFERWNANLRGVDINHNFDAGWQELHKAEQAAGIFGPGPTRYGGPHPESEPETAALTGLCEKYAVRHLVSFHSQGEVIYWDHGGLAGEKSRKMAEIFAASSGYALDIPTGLSVGGGFKDWFIEKYRRPAFTVEIGKGKNPLPPSDGERIYERIKEMMLLGLLM